MKIGAMEKSSVETDGNAWAITSEIESAITTLQIGACFPVNFIVLYGWLNYQKSETGYYFIAPETVHIEFLILFDWNWLALKMMK